ncbi:hypothetical protein GQ597_11735 [Gilliamella sp. Pra-s65]|uniref:hypothetical protein n=1 Tax=unclassified Gilliamella TaxID=2685620 RepID=UPI0013652E4E|nr:MULTISPECIES: hypothetical protein [unclassified Gilliamella]MWN91364.1 hypothetical protein [Gilliamella sp. Pra-s65]MWP48028.1 hypothetical protein [Gilliamella sp. Pas-s27]MWP74327.1 hypothetical protein [Gilliamella sp. Pra-s52]
MARLKKYDWLKKFIFFIFIFLNYSYCYAKEKNSEQTYWILDEYFENNQMINKKNDDYLNNLSIKFKDNIFYINENRYPVKIGKVANISQLIPDNLLHSDLLKNFPLPKDEVHYLQFDSSIDSNFAKLLLPEQKVIYLNDQLVFINQEMALSFLKPAGKNAFKQISKHFPSLKLPYNSRITGDFIKDNNYKHFYYNFFNENEYYTHNIPRSFVNYLQLSNNNLYAQRHDYITHISGIKLPVLHNRIRPILIEGLQRNGEMITYLYLFSDNFDVLDKIILKNPNGLTRKNSEIDDLAQGFIYYNIDKNYQIERQQRFTDETIEIQHYKIAKDGKFREIPVISNCYKEFATKNNNIHSKKSLLLTNKQGNNYLRFAHGLDYDQFESTILTLNPNEEKLCVNYQQAYSISFGKVNSKQFFGDDELYQQHVENFKSYDIDISNELEYITIHGFEKTPFSKFLLNGNQAIYMKNTLFFVSENHFTAYRQPTDEELTYQ